MQAANRIQTGNCLSVPMLDPDQMVLQTTLAPMKDRGKRGGARGMICTAPAVPRVGISMQHGHITGHASICRTHLYAAQQEHRFRKVMAMLSHAMRRNLLVPALTAHFSMSSCCRGRGMLARAHGEIHSMSIYSEGMVRYTFA